MLGSDGSLLVAQLSAQNSDDALFFGNFWLTIQNTGNWHVSNAFDLLSVFISFPLARAAAAAAKIAPKSEVGPSLNSNSPCNGRSNFITLYDSYCSCTYSKYAFCHFTVDKGCHSLPNPLIAAQ
jgi:hypothetical protein